MRKPRAWIGWHDRKLLKTGLLVLALLFQGYIGQAHFHNLAAFNASGVTLSDGAPGPGSDTADLPANRPDGHNTDCTICHLTGLSAAEPVAAIVIALPLPYHAPLLPSDASAPPAARTSNHSPRGPPTSFVQS